jgi:hypothetical protein
MQRYRQGLASSFFRIQIGLVRVGGGDVFEGRLKERKANLQKGNRSINQL